MYHAVGQVAKDPFHLYVTPERFRRQMATLARLGLRGVSVGELGDALAAGGGAGLVAVTFDDGYRDVMRFALPVLRRYGFTATIFVVAGLLGRENAWDPPPRRELMTGDDLRRLTEAGHEVGSHGDSHARLAGLEPGALAREVAGSRTALGRLLGVPPRSFCYPYGAVDTAAVRAVADAGYSYACAVQRTAGPPDPLTMPRIGIAETDGKLRFAARLVLRGR
jgi:peptidoglycan/xylan/chitin deacetylase (PgdA/CDA1 family)